MTLLIRVIIAFYEILKPTYNMKECLEAKKQTIQWGFHVDLTSFYFCFFSYFPFEIETNFAQCPRIDLNKRFYTKDYRSMKARIEIPMVGPTT